MGKEGEGILVYYCIQCVIGQWIASEFLLAANASLQIVRGMMTLYGEADLKERVVVVAEFKKVLTLYLGSVLSEDAVLPSDWTWMMVDAESSGVTEGWYWEAPCRQEQFSVDDNPITQCSICT
jgi:hypothetical protein